ncbi:MAG: N-acetyl sugar amidotransferase [Rhodospirillales bacterium]|nr:N-acetyl sugar amidotransferase [Rhodospirillales bacterium]
MSAHPGENQGTLFGLPAEVRFCKRCVISNQRPSAAVEFRNRNAKDVIAFDEEGVCSACRFHELKYGGIDWDERQRMLLDLLDRHRSRDGGYDIIVPGSGGKDSVYVAHVLKHKYGMHPLTVTWPPHLYTDIGRRNFDAWLDTGFDNVTFHPNGKVHRELTRFAFLNLLHPFQPFILGQKQIGPKMALKYGVKLVMYGESQAEGGTNMQEGLRPAMNPKYYSIPKAERSSLRVGGLGLDELLARGLTSSDLLPYVPAALEDVLEAAVEVHHMGFYERWVPQEKYYYAAEHCGFKPNPERSEGTYSKYSSLDDKIDGFHYYTTYIKFGIGRATYDAAQEIRNGHLTRDEGIALVNRYDGEFPKKYFPEFLDYIGIDEDTFWKSIDACRSPHLWCKEGNDWVLRHKVA